MIELLSLSSFKVLACREVRFESVVFLCFIVSLECLLFKSFSKDVILSSIVLVAGGGSQFLFFI